VPSTYTQLASDFSDIHEPSLECECGLSRDDEEVANARQRRRDLFNYAIRKVLVCPRLSNGMIATEGCACVARCIVRQFWRACLGSPPLLVSRRRHDRSPDTKIICLVRRPILKLLPRQGADRLVKVSFIGLAMARPLQDADDKTGDAITAFDSQSGKLRAKILKTAPGNAENLAP
jgi:hypothetical protein